jgi:site-specific DNA-methyltransferase (adenine-specific)
MLLNDDCLVAMQKLIDDGVQVDSIVCDPPYGLQFMGNEWDKLWRNSTDADQKYVENTKGQLTSRARKLPDYKASDPKQMQVWHENWAKLAFEILKPGGFLLAFSGSRTYHRMAVAVEDAGFEIRDQIMWLYGSGFPKSLNLGDGWGTALKPAHEPIVMARKFIEGTNKNNREKYGTGGINIDGCRIPLAGDKKQATAGRRTIKWGVNEGGSTYEKGTGAVYTETGRFPANVMHDGSVEVVSGFPNAKGAVSNGGAKIGETSNGVISPMRRGTLKSYADDGSAARFFYCPKVSKSERGEDNTHPTVKPQELMKYLCRLVTPKGGTVLDPFMGSGSTGMAAKDEGFEFIGIEKEKEYFKIAESRINATAPLTEFFE